MTKMNKAQEKYTQDFREKYYGHKVTSKILHMFISGFTEIDPTPDTKKYVVRLAGGVNNDHATVNNITFNSREDAVKDIQRFVQNNIINGFFNILNYNLKLEEVSYSVGEIVYKRWVEEVE
jgi:hypothetical protein